MWSVVVFNDDQSVEAVPSYWFIDNNNTCAWPKKNSKKCLVGRVVPNNIDFDYFSARKLGKNIDDYLIAREKAKKAENTSSLSTNESSQENDSKFIKITKKHKINNRQKSQNKLWSPSSDIDFEECEDINYHPYKKNLAGTSSSSSTIMSPDELQKVSNSVSGVKKQLEFSQKKLLDQGSFINTIQPTLMNPYGSQSNNPSKIVPTSSSPFKVTDISSEDILYKSQSSQISAISRRSDDILDKVNRNLLIMKYDIKTLIDKVEKLEEHIHNINCGDSNNVSLENTFLAVLNDKLPLKTEDNLLEFEKNLLDNSFRLKLVSELSRYARGTLPSTIRTIMRRLFTDNLLQNYSYKGQKKKNNFSLLSICFVIFDAVKMMKKFEKFDKIMVEEPIKIFLAGAKFRVDKPLTMRDVHIKDDDDILF